MGEQTDTTAPLDETDRKILNLIQKSFPLAPEPFKAIGEAVGIGEDEAFERVRRLKETGIIRRIGAVFDSRKMGFTSTLVAASVPDDKVDSFVRLVNALPGVTHNYRRNHRYNIWFTVISESAEDLAGSLREISRRTDVTDIISLAAVRTFKIDASFNFDAPDRAVTNEEKDRS